MLDVLKFQATQLTILPDPGALHPPHWCERDSYEQMLPPTGESRNATVSAVFLSDSRLPCSSAPYDLEDQNLYLPDCSDFALTYTEKALYAVRKTIIIHNLRILYNSCIVNGA